MTARRLAAAGLAALALALTPAVASAANTWAGVWNSDFGRMTLDASGSGSYEGFSPGTISGKVTGNVDEGTWHQPGDPPKSGKFKFTLSGDGRSFTGDWSYDSGGCGSACGWNGTCIEGACLENGSARATPPAASPKLGKGQKEATLFVAEDDGEADFLDDLAAILAKQASPKDRFMTCVLAYKDLIAPEDDDGADVAAKADPALLMLTLCLKVAADVNDAKSPRTAQASGCGVTQLRAPVRITRSGDKLRGRLTGDVEVERSPLLVTCLRQDSLLTMTIKPRAPGRTLRSIVGPRLRVGLINRLGATGSPTPIVGFARR